MVKADIETADIDWSHIKDLVTDTAIITQGTAGELYIAKLAVTEANMVSLTVGELVVKGSDGHFYSVSVDENGEVVTTLKQVANDDVADLSIHGTEKLIEGSITAKTLNVQEIFGDNATIRSLIAANIDVDTLFAREATLNAINAMDITSNTYLKLMVAEKADQSAVDALGERMDAAELKITPDAIVSTVTGSQQYQEDLASISVSGSGIEMIRLRICPLLSCFPVQLRSVQCSAGIGMLSGTRQCEGLLRLLQLGDGFLRQPYYCQRYGSCGQQRHGRKRASVCKQRHN